MFGRVWVSLRPAGNWPLSASLLLCKRWTATLPPGGCRITSSGHEWPASQAVRKAGGRGAGGWCRKGFEDL